MVEGSGGAWRSGDRACAAAGCSDGSGLNGPQGVDNTAVPVAAPAPANPLPLGGSDEAGDAAADEPSAELAAQQAEKARLEQTIAELGKQIEELKAARTEERGDEDDDERDTDRRIADLEGDLAEAMHELEIKQDQINTWREGIARLRDENRTLREEARQSAAAESQESATTPPAPAAVTPEPEDLLKDAVVTLDFSEVWDVTDIDGSGITSTGYPVNEADFLCVLFFTEATFNTNKGQLDGWFTDYHDDDDNCDEIDYGDCTRPLELADGFTCIDLGPCDEENYNVCDGTYKVPNAQASVKFEDVTHLAVLINDGGDDDPDVSFTIDFKKGPRDSTSSPSDTYSYEQNGLGLYWLTRW